MQLYEEFGDSRVITGIGSALYYKNGSGKFSLLLPLETVPSIASNPESIEFDVTTSTTKGKINGKVTLDEKEVDVYNHRDNMRRIKALEGKTLEFLKVSPDYSAERFTGTVSITPQDSTSDNPEKATMKIVPKSSEGFIENCYDLIQPTCHFSSEIESVVYLNSASKDQTFKATVELIPADGTVKATSLTPSVATVTCTGGDLVITPVAKGSCIVELEASKEEYAPWTTTILVIVK